jgi:hypothetical protein
LVQKKIENKRGKYAKKEREKCIAPADPKRAKYWVIIENAEIVTK